MSVWHYTDAKGVRVEVSFTAEQLMADQQVLGEFTSAEQLVADGEEPPTLTASSPMLKKIALLPTKRAEHWRAELQRIGVKVKEEKKVETKIGVIGDNNLGGSK